MPACLPNGGGGCGGAVQQESQVKGFSAESARYIQTGKQTELTMQEMAKERLLTLILIMYICIYAYTY